MSVLTKSAQTIHITPDEFLGVRLRTLRKQAEMSQTELAGGRFSKEYVSQIERGKTCPTPETLVWLAERLGVDAAFLARGVGADERSRVEATLARGEAMLETRRFDEAVAEFSTVRTYETPILPEHQLRALAGEGWAKMLEGHLKEALALQEQARALSEDSRFSDLDRADVVFRTGACRYQLGSMQTAISLFTEALTLAEGAGLPCDRLRSDILRWRSGCYRRLRDWEAAREDIERALELSEALGDARARADTYFHASLIAERTGHWVLARSYAERAKLDYEQIEDQRNIGRLLNNLGAFNFELGNPEQAVASFKDAFRVALEHDNDVEAGYAVSSLARVHLETEKPEQAEEQARKALELLDGREDHMSELGAAQLTLGRALAKLDRLDEAEEWLLAAQNSFEQFSSPGHRSAAYLARGDLAKQKGDTVSAARLYRAAAELLQDVRF